MLSVYELALFLAVQSKVWQLVRHFGGLAFIPLGLLDQSVIPVPGSLDAVLIFLAAANHELWWYYAIMATMGSLAGGYVSFRIGRKGGKEALEKKLKKQQVEKVYGTFERYGFFAIAVPAILPPPVPIVPFVMAAGAMNYPLAKFVGALTAGRILRFGLVGYFAGRYGEQILGFFSHYYRPIAIGLGALAVVSVITVLVLHFRGKRNSTAPGASTGRDGAKAA